MRKVKGLELSYLELLSLTEIKYFCIKYYLNYK